MPTELQQLQQFYKNFKISVSTEWLESCIEWCKDGNLPPNYNIKDLQDMVYEQWLVLDLRDVEVPSLPRNLSNEEKYCLTGSYSLQMMQVIDISKPKLWQLQRIRNNIAKNTEAEKDFGKRVLQLTLTDGVQEVEAMEFQPISCLSINLLPGTKLRFTGPLMVRNGRLMLKEENVKCLGGSVDEIRVQFAAENVLARALRLEENPNPYTIDENALEVFEANTTTQMNGTANTQNHNALNQNRNSNQNSQAQPRTNTIPNHNINRNYQNSLNSNQEMSKTQTTVSNRRNYNEEIPPEFQVDDDLLRELEADFEENSVRNRNNKINSRIPNINTNIVKSKIDTVKTTLKSNKNNRSRACSSPDLFDEMEVDDELLNEHLDQIADHMSSNAARRSYSSDITRRLGSGTENTKTFSVDKNTKVVQDLEVSSSILAKTKPVINDEVITLDDSFEDIDIDSHLDNIDEEMANLPSSTQIRNDLKNRVKSPELKSRKISSNNPKPSFDIDSTSFNKPLSNSKLIQGTLNFGSSKNPSLNLLPSIKLNSQEVEDNNPFSIFKKQTQKATNMSEFYSSSKPSSYLPQRPVVCPGSPEFESKHLPSTSSNLPQKSSNFGLTDFESNHLPSTSNTSSRVTQNSAVLSPESHITSSKILQIEKLKIMMPNIGKGKFKIKGKFRKVAEKLQQTDDSYHFVIVVEDITGDLTVQLHSELVTNIVGVTPKELANMRVLALQQDVEVKRQIVQLLANLHQRCLNLDNILEIQVTRGKKYPVLMNII